MRIYAKTDRGKERNMNQDFYAVVEDMPEIKLCILADGMGGYEGGEIASKVATVSAKEYIIENIKKVSLQKKEEIMGLIRKAMEHANTVVNSKSRQDKNLREMGTTLEICLIYNNKVYIGHIGDSRIYRIRKDIIRKITTDHSYVETLVKEGKITKEEAFYHPEKNMLIKALGCTPKIEPDILVKGFLKDDVILMCSDGLTNMLKEKEIYETIIEKPETAVDRLTDKANALGGYDNISIIIIIKGEK